MRMIRRILHPSDFSSASRPAFRRAVEMAVASGATLWIGHVVPPAPESTGRYAWPRMYREMDLYIRRDAEKRLRDRG